MRPTLFHSSSSVYPFLDNKETKKEKKDLFNNEQIQKIREGDKTRLTIVLVLDKSGSMADIRSDMIGSLSTFMADQKKITEDPPQVSLILFNHSIDKEASYINHSITEVEDLSYSDYRPSGSTALYDALGCMLDAYEEYSRVIMVVITDGEENASRYYKHSEIKEKINQKTEKGWQFVYLSDNLEVAKQGDSIGLHTSSQTMNCAMPKRELTGFLCRDISTAVKNYRQTSCNISSQLTSTSTQPEPYT
jgi:Mg-chelatase subunit ChlD